MPDKKTVPERVKEIYEKKPQQLDGAPEVQKCGQFITSLFVNSGLNPKSKEGKIYGLAINGIKEAHSLLSRANEEGIDFAELAVQKLIIEATDYIVENHDDPKEADNCKICKKFVVEAKSASGTSSQPAKGKTSATVGATEEDHKILETFVNTVGIPKTGINKKNIPDLLKKALDDPSIENVKLQEKGSKKVPSFYVGEKPYRFDLVAKSCNNALKENVQQESSKYWKEGYFYKSKVS